MELELLRYTHKISSEAHKEVSPLISIIIIIIIIIII
jgi:hypothetical protein